MERAVEANRGAADRAAVHVVRDLLGRRVVDYGQLSPPAQSLRGEDDGTVVVCVAAALGAGDADAYLAVVQDPPVDGAGG
jgi:hypothetical protein